MKHDAAAEIQVICKRNKTSSLFCASCCIYNNDRRSHKQGIILKIDHVLPVCEK
jgi:hypothetical protein